jgi:hypothetical protein
MRSAVRVTAISLWLCAALAVQAVAQYGIRAVPLGFCSDSSLSSAASLTSFTCASFTGTGNGTTLTVTSVTGSIQPGQTVSGTGVPTGTVISGQVTNADPNGIPGRAGTYKTSKPTTSSANSLTTAGAPQQSNYAVICAYVQAINYRDDGTTPTNSTGSGGQGIAAGNCIGYAGTMQNLQFIQLSGGAIVGVSFYYVPSQ